MGASATPGCEHKSGPELQGARFVALSLLGPDSESSAFAVRAFLQTQCWRLAKQRSLPHRMVYKGHRKPLEIEDVWELKDKDRTQAIHATFEKNMKTALRKAQAELEKRKRKKRRREHDTEHMNGMSKAQSQDVLVLVKPFPRAALHEMQRSKPSLVE